MYYKIDYTSTVFKKAYNAAYYQHTESYMYLKHTSAFTLVELIVVIMILAILGLLGFISISRYTKDARNSTRIHDLTAIHKVINLEETKSGFIPFPDKVVTIKGGESVYTYQGIFSEELGQKLGLMGEIQDPSTQGYYTYVVDATKTRYQLGASIEGSLSQNYPSFFQQSYAQNKDDVFTIFTRGFAIGILYDSKTNTPIHLIPEYENAKTLDLLSSSGSFTLKLKDHEQISGSGAYIYKSGSRGSCERLFGFGYAFESGEYTISEAGKDILVYCHKDIQDTNFYTTILDGDFENSYADNWPSSKITKKEIAGNTIGEVAGYIPSIFSNNFIYVQPGKNYTLSGDFKSAGNQASRFYYGFVEYDENFNIISPSFAFGYEGTESMLSRPFTNGDSNLYFEDTDGLNCQNWKNKINLNSLAVAFDVDPSGNLEDIPNRHVTNSFKKVSFLEDIGDECLLHFSESMNIKRNSFPTGTHIRAHQFYGAYNYIAAADKYAPMGSFQIYTGTIEGISDNITARYTHFRKGTKFVKVMILPNFVQDSNSILHMDNLILETH